jgi:hypothetical protein
MLLHDICVHPQIIITKINNKILNSLYFKVMNSKTTRSGKIWTVPPPKQPKNNKRIEV